jgi:hypothetical protein
LQRRLGELTAGKGEECCIDFWHEPTL